VYGVPSDLELSFLHGSVLIQLCLGQFQVQLHFQPVGSISVEGEWELLDPNGVRIDNALDWPRPPFQLHRLLGCRVIASEVQAPRWFSLRFESGEVLRIFDDSEQYESFSIQPGNIYV
jgi:hypothetical protein